MYLISLIKKYPKLSMALLSFIACFGAYFYGKSQANTVVKIEVEEKIIEKIVEVEVEKESKNTEKITIIEKRPDGTKTIRIEEREKTDKTTKISKESDTKTDKTTLISEEGGHKTKHKVGINAYFNRDLDPYYGVEYGRRLLGPLWIKAEYINYKNPQVGFGISWEF